MYPETHRARRSRRQSWLPLTTAVLVGGLLLVSGTAVAEHAEMSVMTIDGCNEQPIGEGGHTIRWTSAFQDGKYDFQGNKVGNLLVGHGPLLEVSVHYSIHDPDGDPIGASSVVTDLDFRGSGLTPDGVAGGFVDTNLDDIDPLSPSQVQDPSDCGITDQALAHTHTFTFEFAKLHQPGRRSIAKGNAQIELTVEVDGDDELPIGTARLGTNLHVATGDDLDG